MLCASSETCLCLHVTMARSGVCSEGQTWFCCTYTWGAAPWDESALGISEEQLKIGLTRGLR